MQSPMCMAKKLLSRLPYVAASKGSTTFYVPGTGSKEGYLVDTGACRSLIPRKYVPNPGRKGKPLKAANGSRINTYGFRQQSIDVGGRHYKWKFLVADVFLPILGADFLAAYHLLVDVRRKMIYPAADNGGPKRPLPQPEPTQIASIQDDYSDLIKEFSEVFASDLTHRPSDKTSHSVVHHIKTEGPPVYAKFRRLSPEKQSAAKKVFSDLERQGICQKASSLWTHLYT